MDSKTVYKEVQDHYGSVARATNTPYSAAIAQAFGYSEDDLNSIPTDANLGLSCGNPLAIASLREGETVIDLGSGAGFDVFLAANKVGARGRAIGVDMNKDMLARARTNQAKSTSPAIDSVSFVEGNIAAVPLEAGIADCIISNCVINLVPDAEKPAVFAEMARLLKPGGRVAVSDILARKPLPARLRGSVALYVGCVAGCSVKEEYVRFLEENGFGDIVILDTGSDLNVYVDLAKDGDGKGGGAAPCCGPSAAEIAETKAAVVDCCSTGKETAGCCSKTEDDTMPCCASSASGATASNAETGCCSSASLKTQEDTAGDFDLADIDINEWAGSFKILALKL